MKTPTVQAALENLVAAIRAELKTEFLSLIDGANAPRSAARRKGSKSAGAEQVQQAPKAKRRKGGKRTPEELEALTKSVLTYIRKNAGQRVEQIAEGLGTTTRELVLPISKLLADKALKTQGVRRGTTYSVRE